MIASDMGRETPSYGCCVPAVPRLQRCESPALTDTTHPKTLQDQGWLLKAQTGWLLSPADPRVRQTPKMTHKRGWPNGSEPIWGSCATSPRCHPVDPSRLHSLCPQGPFPAESTTFVQVIMKSQTMPRLSKLYLHLLPSALESRVLYIFRSKLYLILIFK